jgi:hypothetical protein
MPISKDPEIRGNFIVHITVQFPSTLSSKHADIIKDMFANEPEIYEHMIEGEVEELNRRVQCATQ